MKGLCSALASTPARPQQSAIVPSHSMDTDAIDTILLNIASKHGSLPSLLNTFFSFLHRRTDFYVVDDSPTRPMGFANGVAEKMLLSAMHKFAYKRVGSPGTTAPSASPSRPVQCVSDDAGSRADPRPSQPVLPEQSQPVSSDRKAPAAANANTTGSGRAAAAAAPSLAMASAKGPLLPALLPRGPLVHYTPAGLQVPVNNGGSGAGHWWSQTLSEVTLYVPLPPGVTAKDVVVKVTPSALRVSTKRVSGGDSSSVESSAAAPSPPAIIEGDFYAAIKAGDAIWSVDSDPLLAAQRPIDPGPPGEASSDAIAAAIAAAAVAAAALPPAPTLVLTLEKAVETWWRSALAGGAAQIDATLVDSTVPLLSYDEETQAAIRKIMFDQAQKAAGRPSSDELLLAAAAAGGGAGALLGGGTGRPVHAPPLPP